MLWGVAQVWESWTGVDRFGRCFGDRIDRAVHSSGQLIGRVRILRALLPRGTKLYSGHMHDLKCL